MNFWGPSEYYMVVNIDQFIPVRYPGNTVIHSPIDDPSSSGPLGRGSRAGEPRGPRLRQYTRFPHAVAVLISTTPDMKKNQT